jgi:hypothetical protein
MPTPSSGCGPSIFTGIEGAASVYPKGYMKVRLRSLLGWLGPMLTAHATDPLPASLRYLAVTPDDMRIFGRAMGSTPFEIGRWKKWSYRASIAESGLRFKLYLEVDRLGRICLETRLRALAGTTRSVFDLVVQSASGPVMQA